MYELRTVPGQFILHLFAPLNHTPDNVAQVLVTNEK